MLCFWIEFAGMRTFQSGNVTREFHCCQLHAEADAEKRHFMLTGIAQGVYLTFYTAFAETTRYEDAGCSCKLIFIIVFIQMFCIDPFDIAFRLLFVPGVSQ